MRENDRAMSRNKEKFDSTSTTGGESRNSIDTGGSHHRKVGGKGGPMSAGI